VIGLAVLLIAGGIMIGLREGEYKVLAGKLDMGWDFQVSPVKISASRPTLVPITITNTNSREKTFNLQVVQPWKLEEGYTAGYESLLSEYPNFVIVPANGHATFEVVLTKHGNRQEIWLLIVEATDNQIRREVAVRFLIGDSQ